MRRFGITPGVFILLIDAILGVAAWVAMERQVYALPPLFVFFVLDHPLTLAIVTLLICGVDWALHLTPGRAICAGLAILLVCLAAFYVREEAKRQERFAPTGHHE